MPIYKYLVFLFFLNIFWIDKYFDSVCVLVTGVVYVCVFGGWGGTTNYIVNYIVMILFLIKRI